MLFSQVVDRFIIAKRAQRFSEHTISDYTTTYKKFTVKHGDKIFNTINAGDIDVFLADMPGAAKTVLNAHTALSSLWRWAWSRRLCDENIVTLVTPPRPDEHETTPFSESEIRALIDAAARGRYPLRDRSIILCLLDTGIRASEICSLRLDNISADGLAVFGKRRKARTVPVSPTTAAALREYLRHSHQPDAPPECPLFLARFGEPMTRSGLLLLIKRIAARAGVPHAYPHRFRHTFAISYLRGGGDIYTLQRIMGHSTLEMVKRYLAVANVDVQSAHARASPVTRWNL